MDKPTHERLTRIAERGRDRLPPLPEDITFLLELAKTHKEADEAIKAHTFPEGQSPYEKLSPALQETLAILYAECERDTSYRDRLDDARDYYKSLSQEELDQELSDMDEEDLEDGEEEEE